MSAVVYIDNENMPYHKYGQVIEKHFIKTPILQYKIFAGIREIAKLDEITRLKHRFIVCPRPITRDKNSADITLVIEIMKDLFKNQAINTFIICSNDSDFIPICKEIHEAGKKCWLVIDSYNNANELLDKIYDKVIDLEFEKKEQEKVADRLRKKQEDEVAAVAAVIDKHRKDLQGQLLILLNAFVATNPQYKKDKEKINISRFESILLGAMINWRLHEKYYKDFLLKYLPACYIIQGQYIIPA
jgi:uncharacterized LabA/DUF88 family protein